MIYRDRITKKILGMTIDDTFLKTGLKQKHLLHNEGGVPAIDLRVWDKARDEVNNIFIRTEDGKVFMTSRDNFEAHKKEIDYGFGRQLTMPIENWTIKTI